MTLRQTCLRLGLGLTLLIAAACAAPAPAPTEVVALPTPTHAPTARPTFIQAVRDTATALAIAAAQGGAPAPTASDTLSPEPPTDIQPTSGPATATPLTDPAAASTPNTPGPSRTPIDYPTGPALPAGCAALHTVQAGEWLTEIARQYGVDVDALARANKLSNLSQLLPGQVLCIPGPSGPATTAARPMATPSPTGAPASGLTILSLTVNPNPVERGAVVRLAWTVRNAAAVTLWPLSYDYHLNQWFRQAAPTYSGAGDALLTVAVPLDARGPLRYELEARDSAGARATAQTELIRPLCYPPFFRGPIDASYCLHPAESAPAEFQRFERGYMIWRSDTGEVFALAQDPGRYTFWLLWSATGASVETGNPPAGEYAPGGHFAEVWARLGPAEIGGSQQLRDVLGWAISPLKTYTLTEQVRLDARFADFDTLYLSWPDGQVAQAFTGGGIPHAGTIGPAWLLFTPTT